MRQVLLSVESGSPEQTWEVAGSLAERLVPGSVVALHGELGAGKTCSTPATTAHVVVHDGLNDGLLDALAGLGKVGDGGGGAVVPDPGVLIQTAGELKGGRLAHVASYTTAYATHRGYRRFLIGIKTRYVKRPLL